MKKTSEVKVRKVTIECEKCGVEMFPTGVTLMSDPPQYPHKCDKCGNTVNMMEIYPRIEYEKIADE